jgi:hypothetical protein
MPGHLSVAITVHGAGSRISDFLVDDGLWKGNRVIAGPASLYLKLAALFEEQDKIREQ